MTNEKSKGDVLYQADGKPSGTCNDTTSKVLGSEDKAGER